MLIRTSNDLSTATYAPSQTSYETEEVQVKTYFFDKIVINFDVDTVDYSDIVRRYSFTQHLNIPTDDCY